MSQPGQPRWSSSDADPLADIAAVVATARPVPYQEQAVRVGPITALPGFTLTLAGTTYAATRKTDGPGYSLTPALDIRHIRGAR